MGETVQRRVCCLPLVHNRGPVGMLYVTGRSTGTSTPRSPIPPLVPSSGPADPARAAPWRATYLERGRPVVVLVRWGSGWRAAQRSGPPGERRAGSAPVPLLASAAQVGRRAARRRVVRGDPTATSDLATCHNGQQDHAPL